MDFSHVLLLSVIQGVTEFLPISSSGHMLVVSRLFGYGTYPIGVDIVLHGSTLGAVLLYFSRDIQSLVKDFFSGSSLGRTYLLSLFFGTIPIALVGWFLYDYADLSVFRSVPVITGAFIFSGLLLLLYDFLARRGLLRYSNIPLRYKGIGIGCFQVFSLLPGVSRSGITIAAGRYFGFSRPEAARFSFLLSIPVILGILLVFLLQAPSTSVFSGVSLSALSIGALVSFFLAIATIHFFLKLVDRIGFVPFFIYQVCVGILLFIL